MSRAHRSYTESTGPVVVAGAIDVTEPIAGHYRYRMGQGTVRGAVRLLYGPPSDPVTGEELDRGWRWQAVLDDGSLGDFDQIWPRCAGDPISADEYLRYVARVAWAREHAPDSAYAKAGRKLDPLSTLSPMPF